MFYNWLKRQKTRNDPIGDLARDAIIEGSFPQKIESVRELHVYLSDKRACTEAHSALDEAWNEYKGKKPLNGIRGTSTMRKELSDEALEDIGREMSKALDSWSKMYDQSMKVLKLNSSEYKAICMAGKKIRGAYYKMRKIAEDRNWSSKKLKEVFWGNDRGARMFN